MQALERRNETGHYTLPESLNSSADFGLPEQREQLCCTQLIDNTSTQLQRYQTTQGM
jgi:hypothetical protein